MPSADRLIEIYHEASARSPGAERDEFVIASCGDDLDLKQKVLLLLHSHESAGDFLEEPLFPPTPVETEKPGDMLGRYKLLEILGEGGCGVVYVAEQTAPVRRRVALKVIKLGMDTKQVIARFDAERQALAMMDSPNIAKVLDAGSTDTGRPFFVMELVRGLRITDYCDQNNLSVKERLDLFLKVCQAIQHAHQKGVIHRDIKPSNILVTLHDGEPIPRVIDFGIAKATEGRLTEGTVYTQFLHFVGTPAYMSPEQAEMSGLDVDTRSDIYSLGVLLYELLTGETPLDGQKLIASGIDQMRKTIREKEAVSPSARLQTLAGSNARRLTSKSVIRDARSAIHGDLDSIVLKCLEKDRRRRYETASALAADLQRHLNNEPVLARPQSTVYKLGKAFRRNRVAFIAVSAVAIALLLGATVSTWLAVKARTAQRGLEAEKVTAQYNLYVANINLAGKAWGENNIDQLRKVLEETRLFPDRGFEWYYWQRQAHLNLCTLRGHLDAVWSVAFSLDGQRLVTASDDHTARVWEAASGRELFKLVGHTAKVKSAVFSRDGRFIVTAGDDHVARVWNVADQHEIFSLKHTNRVTGVAFSPNGERIATASHDGTAKIWDAQNGRELLAFRGHTSNVLCVAFSPDGTHVVTGSEDRTARIWDAATGTQILPIPGHGGRVLSVAFSPDGRRVLTGCGDKIARVWDAGTGEHLLDLRTPGPVGGLAMSPDGQRILTGTWDSTAGLWNARTGKKLLTIRADSMAVQSVAFSPDGERIVTTGGDGTAQIWEIAAVEESLLVQESDWPAVAVAISPDGQQIVTAAGPDEISISTGNEAAQVWDTASRNKAFTLNGHEAGITSVAYSPDRLWIVTGSVDQTARVWKASTGEPVQKLQGHIGSVNSVGFSPDSRRIVTGGQDRTAKVWDAASGAKAFDLRWHTGTVTSAAFSPDGQWIAVGSLDETATLWDASSGVKRGILQSTNLGHVQCVAFSPDSKRIVTGGWPRTAIIWDVATGREIMSLIGHLSPVSSIAFSDNGRRIVTSSWDRSAKVWDANKGRELLTLNRAGEILGSVAFSRDGLRIVTGDMARTACMWQAAGPEEVALWDAEENAAAQSRERWRRELDDLFRANRRAEVR
jgi:WD40 repeat protein/serine/threonine protein kinase